MLKFSYEHWTWPNDLQKKVIAQFILCWLKWGSLFFIRFKKTEFWFIIISRDVTLWFFLNIFYLYLKGEGNFVATSYILSVFHAFMCRKFKLDHFLAWLIVHHSFPMSPALLMTKDDLPLIHYLSSKICMPILNEFMIKNRNQSCRICYDLYQWW